MVERLLGHWKLEKNENFDAYMKANGKRISMLLTEKNIIAPSVRQVAQ